MTKPLLNTKEIAALLGLKPRGVECLVEKRKIPALKISGRCVRFDQDAVFAALGKFEQKAVGQ